MSDKDSVANGTDGLHIKLDQTLDAAAEAGREILKQGHSIATEGQSLIDWSEATKDLLKETKDATILDGELQNWKRVNNAAFSLKTQLSETSYLLLSSTTLAANVGSMMVLGLHSVLPTISKRTTERIQELATRPEIYRKVAELLRQFGLDNAQGNLISAFDHFETSHKQYQINAAAENQATTWLIPMRECILTVLDHLLKQLPVQKKQKGINNKVLFILKGLTRTENQDDHFRNLADQCKQIIKEGLSPSKHRSISREEGQVLLLSSTMWLKSFLSLLNPEEFRKTAR